MTDEPAKRSHVLSSLHLRTPQSQTAVCACCHDIVGMAIVDTSAREHSALRSQQAQCIITRIWGNPVQEPSSNQAVIVLSTKATHVNRTYLIKLPSTVPTRISPLAVFDKDETEELTFIVDLLE